MKEWQVVAEEIARYFHAHLRAELEKSSALLDGTTFAGKTPRRIAEEIIDQLLREFPDLESREPAPYNFIKRWSERNRLSVGYENFSFEAYNIIFMERVLRLKNWDDPGSAERYRDVIRRTHGEYDYRSRKWSPATFLSFENNMREVLREIVLSIDSIDREESWKIKTIGDAYMCAGGITSPMPDHAVNTTKAALAMRDAMVAMKEEGRGAAWEARIGVHTGPLVAGVIGKKKFSYDIWGDTVNTASRMESAGEPNRVNVSSATYECIKDFFVCEPRGLIEVKGKGPVEMYFADALA